MLRMRELCDAGAAPMSVFFYHRVANSYPNMWTIPRDQFKRHIECSREHATLISLAELQRRSRLGFNSEPTVSITMDDAYAENNEFAIPFMVDRGIPCTYFVTVGNVKNGTPFLHDVKRKRPLPVNSIAEIRAMADAGIEIGLHTRSHFDFSGPATAEDIRVEIATAADELSQWIGKPIKYFAFPYGMPQHLSPIVIDAVRDAGMDGYCSAYGAYNFPGDDPFHIRRIHGDPQKAMFRNWITYDESKVRKNQTIHLNTVPLSRPLRTMFVITSMPVGGAETLLVNLINRFDPNRIRPEIACLKEPGPLGEMISDRHVVHHGLLGNKWDVRVLGRLSQLMRDRRTDAVVTVGAGDKMFWGRLAARRAGVPVICSAIHSTGWPDGIGKLNRMLTKITDAFIACADHHGRHLSEVERFPQDRVHVVRNGVDCNKFVPNAVARQTLRAELSVPQSAKLVGIVAALRVEKNHAMFVDVAKQVVAARADTHFVIIGDGPERPGIESLIQSHGLADRVHLLGTRHDIPALIAAMDLFLLCSHNEASPVSILEALASEVPVISTRVGSVAESVIEGETGYLVACDDRASMSNHVLGLLDDDGRRGALGRRGREVVMQIGSLESMVMGYTNLIETIYAKKRGFPSPAGSDTTDNHSSASTSAFPNLTPSIGKCQSVH